MYICWQTTEAMKRWVILLLIALNCLTTRAQGLHFRGMECPIKDRTSMSIHPVQRFRDSLVLGFDFSPTKENDVGFIFRIGSGRDDNNTGGVCLYMDSRGADYTFNVILEGVRSISELSIPRSEVQEGKWLPVSFKLSPPQGQRVSDDRPAFSRRRPCIRQPYQDSLVHRKERIQDRNTVIRLA